ncbi:MAG TPA: hypothetical protein VGI14_06660 [Casimicrobiaceae bacterium]|jgi:hypothetical protein
MHLDYQAMPAWPPLAWLAKLHKNDAVATILHGAQVETTDDWFCEAVWPDDYESGGFDLTDIVSGSGGRLRGKNLVFVSAGATVDRLASIEAQSGVYVSNSLPCLLAAIGARFDPSYPDYFADLNSIIQGVDKYRRSFETSAGVVKLTYFHNLTWDGSNLDVTAKAFPRRDFGSFARYRDFMAGTMSQLARNINDPKRTTRYTMLGTLSTGYDSPTVTTLAREAGCIEALCIDKAMHGHDDSGDAIAEILGVQAIRIRRAEWREFVMPEPPFIVGDGLGQDLAFRSAERLLRGRVLMTGYHGKVWQKQPGKYLSETIVRADSSGLSMTEYRLSAGFIHCPITFWGVRQTRELNALSNAPEMKQWDIPGMFKDYSKPICRRIVEQAGVPRELFGQLKKAGSVLSEELLAPASMSSYLAWLKDNRSAWVKRGRVPPPASPRLEAWLSRTSDSVKTRLNRTPLLWRFAIAPAEADMTPSWLRRYIFPWAMEQQTARYAL